MNRCPTCSKKSWDCRCVAPAQRGAFAEISCAGDAFACDGRKGLLVEPGLAAVIQVAQMTRLGSPDDPRIGAGPGPEPRPPVSPEVQRMLDGASPPVPTFITPQT